MWLKNIKGKRLGWRDVPKDRQVNHLNYLFLSKNINIDNGYFRMIKTIFKSESGITLDDLEPRARERLIYKIFFYKFEKSCSNAKYVRCEKKKGYENVKFLLGDWSRLIINLRQNRPDLVVTGVKICEEYIHNQFNNKYAPIIHRQSDSGNYDWNNIKIMTKGEHDELTKRERERKRESKRLEQTNSI